MQAVIAAVDVAPAQISIGDWLTSNWFDSTVDSPLAQTFLAVVGEILGIDPQPIGSAWLTCLPLVSRMSQGSPV